MQRRDAERVSREEPCAICKHPDWCMRLGRYHLCMRVESDRPHHKGGWLHRRDDVPSTAFIPPPRPRISDAEMRLKWEPIARRAAETGIDRLPELALQLGVSVHALALLSAGYDEEFGWTFPERNAKGWIIGIARRALDGAKLFCKGGRRGLTYCPHWSKRRGVVWVVEGASDVAAALGRGLCCIGRPSNTGGVEMLAEMLRPLNRRIVVLGENDRKDQARVQEHTQSHDPNCRGCMACWPGRAGAIQTAKALAIAIGRPVGWTLPPRGIKDMREYVRQAGKEANYAATNTIIQAGRLPAPRGKVHQGDP